MKDFKQLKIWKLGREIVKEIYLIMKELPKSEQFGISSQIQRAACSIPANIAEGSSRKSEKDYARFIQIALGSAFEVETFLILLIDLNLASEQTTLAVLDLIKEEQKMLSGFLKVLNK